MVGKFGGVKLNNVDLVWAIANNYRVNFGLPNAPVTDFYSDFSVCHVNVQLLAS